jgi:hypothetical protein
VNWALHAFRGNFVARILEISLLAGNLGLIAVIGRLRTQPATAMPQSRPFIRRSLARRRAIGCAANPGPSQPVAVAAMGTVSDAVTIPSPITSDLQTGTWTNLLSTGYHQGSSGGGVFDPKQGCLWGILAFEPSGPSKPDGRFLDLTAFVPATKIAPFLEAYRNQAADGAEAPAVK